MPEPEAVVKEAGAEGFLSQTTAGREMRSTGAPSPCSSFAS